MINVIQKKTMRGTSLLEVTIAITILSIGLLSANGYLLAAIRYAQSALWHSLAIQQANNFAEELTFLPRNQIQNAKEDWNICNKKLLPQGKGTVLALDHHQQIIVEWHEPSALAVCTNPTITSKNISCVQESILRYD